MCSSEECALPVLAGAAASLPRLPNQVAAAVQCALSLAFLLWRPVCFVVASPGQSQKAFRRSQKAFRDIIIKNQDWKAVLYISFIFSG